MNDVLTLIGGGLLVPGAVLFLWMKKRKFDRTNSAGVEQFGSFSGKLASVFWDKCLAGLSAICLIGGAVFLAYANLDTWGRIVPLPFLLVILFGFWW
jgi:hypothetical protein